MTSKASSWRSPTVGYFGVRVQGADDLGVFMECQGLSVSINVHKFDVGGQNGFQEQRPGGMTWPNVKLKRGITDSNGLMDWFWRMAGDGYEDSKDKKLDRRAVTITLYDGANAKVREWELRNAFPVSWSGPSLAAGQSEIASEELEIAHHGFAGGTG